MGRNILIFFVFVVPFIESALLGNAPLPFSAIALYPLVLLVVLRVFPWWQALAFALLGGTWRDLVLLQPVSSSLIASLALVLVYGGLVLLLTNRSIVVSIVSSALAYAAYLFTFWGVSTLSDRLNPSAIIYQIDFVAWIGGLLLASIIAIVFRRQMHHQQLRLPF
ncbi:MAG: hypothetical protein WC817_03695 [Patescibacteria group bacterium]|jgi:hypothetical protein